MSFNKCFQIMPVCVLLVLIHGVYGKSTDNNVIPFSDSGKFLDVVRGTIRLLSTSCDVFTKLKNSYFNEQIDINQINMLYFYSNDFHKYNILNIARVLPNMSMFNKNATTVIFIHGFNSEPDEPLMHEMAVKYSMKEYVNFFSYDVRELVRSDYIDSVRRTPYLAKMLSNFLKKLINMGVKSDTIHLIGFSLGAQIAGFAARRLKNYNNIIHRITALDPAIPCFFTKSEKSLNENDAMYVDVIHTSIISFSDTRMGHADFYLNNNLGVQPGCDPLFIPCSHSRSIIVYLESILNENGFIAKKCGESSLSRNCDRNVLSIMGHSSSPRTRGIYRLKTNSQYPYALGYVGVDD